MFHGWENYYFMVGSAAAGLIGLFFVVVTLTSGYERTSAIRGARIFMSPTVLQFGLVFSASAVTLAPGLPALATACLLGLAAMVGLLAAGRAAIGIRIWAPTGERLHWSDLWFYGLVPTALCLGLMGAAWAVWRQAPCAPFVLAAVLLAILLLGVRNAWDLVVWLTPRRGGDTDSQTAPQPPSANQPPLIGP